MSKNKIDLQSYISKRIRQLRLKKGITQETLENLAELPQKYVYKLERQEPNITINTLEKVLNALDSNIDSFFEISFYEDDPIISDILDHLHDLPNERRKKVSQLILNILKEMY